MKIIAKHEVEKLIGVKEIIPILEKAFSDYTLGNSILPLRTKIPVEQMGGNILFMPAYTIDNNGLGVKVVSVYPGNRNKNRQTIYSVLLLNDWETGEPTALMDAEYLTAIRTGAATGVAAKYLSRKNSELVSIFGAGIQARTQLEAICAVRNIKRAYVFDRDIEKMNTYIEEMSAKLGLEIEEGTKESLKQSDIIITATTSAVPVFEGENVKSGAFISSVGSYTPTMQEVPEEVVCRAAIVVDAYSAALKEAGDILIPMEKGLLERSSIKAELGEVVLGKYERQSEEDIVFFKSVGLAIQDMSVAAEIYDRACKEGLGTDIEL